MYSASKISCSGQQPAMEISSMDMPNLISMVQVTELVSEQDTSMASRILFELVPSAEYLPRSDRPSISSSEG
jgi:hypothetical protein